MAVAVALVVLVPRPARADGLIIPFFGVNFGGDSGENLSTAADSSRFDYGVSFAFMGAGIIGMEADFGYSPDFFGKTDLGGSSVFTGFGNLLLGIPLGGQKGFGFRPYGLVGIGAIKPSGDAFANTQGFGDWKAGFDFGGGVIIFFSNHWGARGDIRYIRSFESLDLLGVGESSHLDFTRGSAGLTIRF